MKFTDEELIAALESEEAQALDSSTGQLAEERADALDRYRGAPLGNEVEGRSQVVDRSIMDTIEWIMPSLVRVYLGGDDIGKFDPRGPDDEDAAKTETEVCNWYLENKNDLFSQINAVLRDALLLKNGYMVGYWQQKHDTMVETYKGKAEEEVALLMQDEEVQIIEHTEYPDPYSVAGQMGPDGQPVPPAMLHDVKVERKYCEEFAAVESIPPDEILVSKRHRWTSLIDADFVEWVRRVSIGQLRAEGFDVADDEPGDDQEPFNLEWSSRDRFNDRLNLRSDNSPDPTRRMVTFRDAYIRMDLRGGGKAQLWRICRIDSSKNILLKEEADIIPFAAFSPLLYPHSHIGTSIYDLIADLGIIKTTLQRQLLDGLYLQQAGRMGVNVNNVNLDDLLVSRPGGVVRVDGVPGDGLFPIIAPDTSQAALAGLDFAEGQKEGRTGVTRYSAGLDANSLNKTATGVQAIQNAANQRIELIARTLATGFKDIFLIVHALACKHSTKPLQMKLKGKWVVTNPREWTRRSDFTISVGLGTGTPEQQLQKLLGLTPLFMQGMQMGLAGPLEAYNFGAEIWKAAGYKNPDRFIKPPKTDPQTGEPIQPPPQKDPIVQAEEVKAQAAMQTKQLEVQFKGQAEQARAMADIEVEKVRMQAQMQTDAMKAEYEAKFAMLKHQAEQETAIKVAQLNNETKIITAEIAAKASAAKRPDVVVGNEKPGPDDPNPNQPLADAVLTAVQGFQEAIGHLVTAQTRPRQVIRGPDGKVVGVQ